MDIEPEVLRSAAGVAVAVAVRGESELDVEVPLPVLRVPALEREERGKPLARQPLHALGLGGRHVEDRVCLDHGDVAARRFQTLRRLLRRREQNSSLAGMVGIPVTRAARTPIHLPERSLPREPHEGKAVARVESSIRERHSAVDEEPRDVVDQLCERRRFATADAHDVQLDAAHPVQTVSVQPRLPALPAVVEDGMNAEEACRGGRDACGCRVPHPVAGLRVKRIQVEYRNRIWGERSQ